MTFTWSRRAIDTQEDVNRHVTALSGIREDQGPRHQWLPILVETAEEIRPSSPGDVYILDGNFQRLISTDRMRAHSFITKHVIPLGTRCLATPVMLPELGDVGWVLIAIVGENTTPVPGSP